MEEGKAQGDGHPAQARTAPAKSECHRELNTAVPSPEGGAAGCSPDRALTELEALRRISPAIGLSGRCHRVDEEICVKKNADRQEEVFEKERGISRPSAREPEGGRAQAGGHAENLVHHRQDRAGPQVEALRRTRPTSRPAGKTANWCCRTSCGAGDLLWLEQSSCRPEEKKRAGAKLETYDENAVRQEGRLRPGRWSRWRAPPPPAQRRGWASDKDVKKPRRFRSAGQHQLDDAAIEEFQRVNELKTPWRYSANIRT